MYRRNSGCDVNLSLYKFIGSFLHPLSTLTYTTHTQKTNTYFFQSRNEILHHCIHPLQRAVGCQCSTDNYCYSVSLIHRHIFVELPLNLNVLLDLLLVRAPPLVLLVQPSVQQPLPFIPRTFQQSLQPLPFIPRKFHRFHLKSALSITVQQALLLLLLEPTLMA